jgi:hypothetical protein
MNPACPCIDPWVDLSAADAAALGGTHVIRMSPDSSPQDVNASHGAAGCAKYDDHMQPLCRNVQGEVPDSGRPEWCGSSWCYVDPDNCWAPHSPSALAWLDSELEALLPPDGLSYSYHTCGNIDAYSSDSAFEEISGRALRVSYPGDSSTGYTILTHPDGSKDGSVVQLMRDIAIEAGFSWEVHPVSADSSARYSSSYTACVHEVALNRTDMCIGNFWMTESRMLLAPFTSWVYSDEFRLIVPLQEEDQSYWTLLQTPFKPFTRAAWWWIFVLVMFMSFSLDFVEGPAHEEVLPDSWYFFAGTFLGQSAKSRIHVVIAQTVGRLLLAVYNGVIGFTTGIFEGGGETNPGKVIKMW